MKTFSALGNQGRGRCFRCVALLVLATTTILTLIGFMFAQDDAAQGDATIKNILTFTTMLGDPGNGSPAAMAKNVIRGYKGPDSPWIILHSAQGQLKNNGQLTVTVRGLVLPNGTNPVPFFRAAVSCQDPTNANNGKLFFTKTFSADAAGNSNIVGTVKLPTHCIAPIILVTSPAVPGNPNGFWFSVVGF